MRKTRNTLILAIALILLLLPPMAQATGDSVVFGNRIETRTNPKKASSPSGGTRRGRRASLAEITWSTEALNQVLVNEKHIDFRVHGDGAKRTFRLNFEEYLNGVLMTVTVAKAYETLTPVYTFDALQYLADIGVTYVRIAGPESESTFEISVLAILLEE